MTKEEKARFIIASIRSELEAGTKYYKVSYSTIGYELLTVKSVIECVLNEGTVCIVPSQAKKDVWELAKSYIGD